jgi:hypothetical protein
MESATDGRKEELRETQVRQGRGEERETRDAQAKVGHAQEWRGTASEGEEQEAGDRDRPLRGPRGRREGSAQAVRQEGVEAGRHQTFDSQEEHPQAFHGKEEHTQAFNEEIGVEAQQVARHQTSRRRTGRVPGLERCGVVSSAITGAR